MGWGGPGAHGGLPQGSMGGSPRRVGARSVCSGFYVELLEERVLLARVAGSPGADLGTASAEAGGAPDPPPSRLTSDCLAPASLRVLGRRLLTFQAASSNRDAKEKTLLLFLYLMTGLGADWPCCQGHMPVPAPLSKPLIGQRESHAHLTEGGVGDR